MKFTPDKYQTETIKGLLQNMYYGIFSDPGFGKTACILKAFEILQAKGYVDRLFVLTKRRIIYKTWEPEVAKWGFNFTVCNLHQYKERNKLFFSKSHDVFLLNFERLDMLHDLRKKQRGAVDSLLDQTMFVIDESTGIKNTNTKRFRMLRALAPNIRRRVIMTGTPAPRSLVDMYAQVWFLDLGKKFGFKTSFLNTYFRPCGYKGYQHEPLDDAYKNIFNKIKHFTIRYDENVFKTPALVVKTRMLQLPPEAQKIYTDMEKLFIAELKSGAITATSTAVRSSKLRQIANGGVYDEDGKYHFIHHEKTDDIVDIVEELNGKPLLIAYEFKHDIVRLKELLPDLEHIGGGVSDKKSNALIDQWNAGKLQYLAGQFNSISHGLSLQEVDAALACYSNTFNLEHYYQFIRRVKRRGNSAKFVILYHLVMEKTIDELIIKSLTRKEQTQKSLLRLIEEHYLHR